MHRYAVFQYPAHSELAPTSLSDESPRPTIRKLGSAQGTSFIQLTFSAGAVMADHQARVPIILQGISGTIVVTIDETEIELSPGTIIHIAAEVNHALSAQLPAVASLIVLANEN